jgi:hypothetical protein
MRTFITIIGMFLLAQGHAQICSEQLSSVPLSNWSTTTNVSYVEDALYLNALNEAQYDGIWSIGSGVSNAHLSVSENASISTFIGVKRRNVVAPSDNIVPSGNVYTIETGYSPLTQNSSETGSLAKWNFLMYINMGDYVFDDVDVRLYIDMDPCYDALVDDMVEINVSEQFVGFFGNANFGAFGINQNLASNFIQAFASENVQPFNPEADGFYTLAIGIYDVCGNLKNWHEVLVNVTDSTDADSNVNGITDSQENGGCTNAVACNYDCAATFNDGSCDFTSCSGCTVQEACNYDASATISNTAGCLYPLDIYGDDAVDCDGQCLNDADGDGVCDENEIDGCTDSAACNYSAAATDDNESCSYPATGYDCDGNCLVDTDGDGTCDAFEIDGCTISGACNFDGDATENDGSCEFTSCAGCTIEEACNFNASATISTVSLCVFAEGCDTCSGETNGTGGVVSNDTDGDGICNDDEILGCTNSTACNYDATATELDDSCDFTSCVGCLNSAACNFDATATITGTCTFPAAFSDCDGCLNDVNGNQICDELEISGCTDSNSTNFNPAASVDDGSCIEIVVGCLLDFAPNYNNAANVQGFPVFEVCFGAPMPAGAPTPLGMVAACSDSNACNYGAEEPCNYDCLFGCQNPNYCDYDPDAPYAGPCMDLQSCYGCTVSTACNYDVANTFEDGSCEYETCVGCTAPTACNYDNTALINVGCVYPTGCDTCSGEQDGTGVVVDNDTDNDGVCNDQEIPGCRNASACNYNPAATDSDGSCEFTSCVGCLNEAACNYEGDDPAITLNEPIQCIFPEPGLDCNGDCLNDADGDFVCDEDEITGCQDQNACNYDAAATDDGGNCTYPNQYEDCDGNCLVDEDGDGVCDQQEVFGCTIVLSCNYDAAATENDGSCEFTSCAGCKNPDACNFDSAAILSDPLLCVFDTNPELAFDAVLELSDAVGDWASNDYLTSSEGAETVTFVDYPGRLSDGRYSVTRIYTATSLCGTLEAAGQLLIAASDQLAGCTNPDATNFDADAINDDASCNYEPACLGDLNEDSIVGASDLLLMLSAFGLPCD